MTETENADLLERLMKAVAELERALSACTLALRRMGMDSELIENMIAAARKG